MLITILKFLPFILFMLVFLFGGHYFLYRSFVGLFGINDNTIKNVIFIVLFALSVGIFLSMAIAHISQSWPARLFYIITASWLGIAMNLLLAALAIRLFIWLIKLTGANFNIPLFTVLIFLAALVFSAYGFWSAFHPQIKNINISIKNLPREWQGKTIVQLSDIHLGHIHGAGFMQDVVDKTNAQNPDLILITGDLFDGMDGDLNVFIKPLNELRAKQGVFYVTGNHETYLGTNEALRILNQTHIRILNNKMIILDGLQIIGLAYPEDNITGKIVNESALLDSLNFDRTKPSILMYHAPANMDQAGRSGISLQLSGHAHKGQIWPFEFFTWLVYGQYSYGLHVIGDFSIYTAGGVGTWGPPMRTTGQPEIPVLRLNGG
ncbi:MAG: hypothetical protein A3B04_01805 [Candidatus Portnoybacteria bacterium RIFCSPLOWO2_02_FULL_39_11]|uniref:Calcineurin-like phosphoesterase domain-containing protein n=1 Tax=Candidatus Portnoybacteria bacterium RIFCSPLOWO2_02_FULL_39_11 TaxID=1802001 RepID=A0A1G2FW34_9BACT|nr:MAG: hypothetical protein A3B04_01805 [Candidatus Portnoybacteria bacterium RIFCSPLOWO2_02_FULL_39_11]